jgi:ATP-independent RNA helicase DbpA
LLDVLRAQGFHALTLNGDLEQHERDQVLIRFANRSCSVLVATDVAARGLDISGLEAVINVDITPDPEIHLHRIGRTGRADENGWALSLCSPAEQPRVINIASTLDIQPDWHKLSALQNSPQTPLLPPMTTLLLLGGRKDKIRPGDILGALTGEAGFSAEQVGKITITDLHSYVAVATDIAKAAAHKLSTGKVKGRPVKVRILRD